MIKQAFIQGIEDAYKELMNEQPEIKEALYKEAADYGIMDALRDGSVATLGGLGGYALHGLMNQSEPEAAPAQPSEQEQMQALMAMYQQSPQMQYGYYPDQSQYYYV